jgi:hypothetical protein
MSVIIGFYINLKMSSFFYTQTRGDKCSLNQKSPYLRAFLKEWLEMGIPSAVEKGGDSNKFLFLSACGNC